MNLTNKSILITGANGGVGMATVLFALKNNAKQIYCAARDISSLETLAKDNPTIVPLKLDITDIKSVNELSSKVDNLDLLINTAGVNSGARVFDDNMLDFDVNVVGNLNLFRAFQNKINEGGAIATITSILALVNLPAMGLYCASKSALHSILQALRAELSSKKVEVYEVLAGPIDTKMTKGQDMPKTKAEDIVLEMFAAIETKTFEVYPDDFAKNIYQGLLENPKAIEANFADSVN